jgi:hypothetical protein
MKAMHMRVPMLIGLSLALATSPAIAQLRLPPGAASTNDGQDEGQTLPQQQRQTPLETNPSGRTARSTVGQVGQRQTRETAAQQAGIKPMARVASRIQNRVQNRIRNRIDRYYDPRANATDPFIVAGEQVRASGSQR